MASNWIEYAGKQIFYVELSGFGSDERALDTELDSTVGIAGQGLNDLPVRSALVLVDLRGTTITRRIQQRITERIADTRKFIRRTAVVGMSGFRRVLLDYFGRLAAVETVGFDDPESAKEWLVS